MLGQHRFRRVFEPSFIRPERLLSELQQDFSDLFQAVVAAPDVRSWSSDDTAVMEIDAPGIAINDVDVAVENDEITVSIPGPAAESTEGRHYFLKERRSGGRRQQFRLPFPADAGRTEAVYEKGVLRITVPRREDSKPARVAVRAG